MTVQTAGITAFSILTVLVALAAAAQVGNEIDQPDKIAQALDSAHSKQRVGEYKAARSILENALSARPGSAALLNALGSVQSNLGEYLEAERSFFRALSACAPSGSDTLHMSIANNLAVLYLETRQYSKAEKLREQLEKFGPRALEEDRIEAATLLNNIATLEHARNRDDEAEHYYARSLELFRKAEGPISTDAGVVETNLGVVELQAGRYGTAADLLREAVHHMELAAGPSAPRLIRPLVGLATCENMRGNPGAAEVIARRAVELSTKVLGRGHR